MSKSHYRAHDDIFGLAGGLLGAAVERVVNLAYEQDTVFTVEDSQEIQRHVPGSRLITVPGANHIIVLNNPEVVEQLILDFLRGTRIFPENTAVAASARAGIPDDNRSTTA